MAPEPPLSLRHRWLAATVLLAAQVMIILDQNIVNVALPAIRDDLAFSPSNLAWAVNAYVIPFGGLLLLAGRLGDLLSRKRVFLTGLTVFAAASLGCGMADDQVTLLSARFVQGVGGAVTAAGLLGMVVTLFPEPGPRAKAIGAFGFASAGGGAAGTVVGGLLTEALSWHWIFFINLPLGILVGALAARLLPKDTGLGWRAGADLLGATLITGGLMLAVYTLLGVGTRNWDSPATIGLGAVSVVLIAAFFVRQATATAPMLPLRILRSRNVSGANMIQALMVGALFGFMFFTVLYLQQVLGFAPLSAGLAFLPAPVVIATVSMALAPRLMTRFGSRPLILAGLPLIIVGFVILTRISADGTYLVDVLPAMLLTSFGFAITMPSLMSLAMSEVSPADAGVVSGLFNTTQQVGGALGLAVLSTAVAYRTQKAGDETVEALTHAYALAFGLAAVFVTVALLVALTVLHPKRTDATVPAPSDAPTQETATAV